MSYDNKNCGNHIMPWSDFLKYLKLTIYTFTISLVVEVKYTISNAIQTNL